MSLTRMYLESKGWRYIGLKKLKTAGGFALFFDHPEHQHEWGMFTQSAAMEHQKFIEKNHTCDCIRQEA